MSSEGRNVHIASARETGSEGKPDFLVATPAVVFQPATLARLSALNLGLTFDQYVYADAPGLDRN